jgi:hypothetical protein
LISYHRFIGLISCCPNQSHFDFPYLHPYVHCNVNTRNSYSVYGVHLTTRVATEYFLVALFSIIQGRKSYRGHRSITRRKICCNAIVYNSLYVSSHQNLPIHNCSTFILLPLQVAYFLSASSLSGSPHSPGLSHPVPHDAERMGRENQTLPHGVYNVGGLQKYTK